MKQEIEQFYTESYSKLVKIYKRRCHSVDVAEDVVQEAFALALQYQDSFNPKFRGFKQWFEQILLNCFRKRMREDKMMGMTDELDEEIIEQEEMPLLRIQIAEDIKREIEKKKDHTEEALNLYFVKGYRMRDIVQVTDFNYKALDKCIQRFKEEMREKYAA